MLFTSQNATMFKQKTRKPPTPFSPPPEFQTQNLQKPSNITLSNLHNPRLKPINLHPQPSNLSPRNPPKSQSKFIPPNSSPRFLRRCSHTNYQKHRTRRDET